jgi:hypothetical protein
VTVAFQGSEPSHAVAICDTPSGARTVVRSEDRRRLDAMTREEHCGREVRVGPGGVV